MQKTKETIPLIEAAREALVNANAKDSNAEHLVLAVMDQLFLDEEGDVRVRDFDYPGLPKLSLKLDDDGPMSVLELVETLKSDPRFQYDFEYVQDVNQLDKIDDIPREQFEKLSPVERLKHGHAVQGNKPIYKPTRPPTPYELRAMEGMSPIKRLSYFRSRSIDTAPQKSA